MMRRPPPVSALSAGGVLWRYRDGLVEIVLCGRSSSGHWGLPKGTPLPGEGLLETAIREVREETGILPTVRAPLGIINYRFASRGVQFNKVVHFYLMDPAGGDVDHHDHEYDLVRWVELLEAESMLTHETEAGIVRMASDLIALIGDSASSGAR